jgi:hypothetical protein
VNIEDKKVTLFILMKPGSIPRKYYLNVGLIKINQNLWINCVIQNNDFPEIIINVNDESSGSEDIKS